LGAAVVVLEEAVDQGLDDRERLLVVTDHGQAAEATSEPAESGSGQLSERPPGLIHGRHLSSVGAAVVSPSMGVGSQAR
jgi:hypothetical protein